MDTKLKEIDVLLDKQGNDASFIGIWGMGGVGKTTLARVVYEKVSHQFEVCIFVANVREVCATHGLVYLQKQIISQILMEENVPAVWDVYGGITMLKSCLPDKEVLLVLDDVDTVEQLDNLMGEKSWYTLRSRIIITTRNLRLLVISGIEKPYELKGLNNDEALQLFSWKAFGKDAPEQDYAKQSKSVVRYAQGLPLALKTLGSFLYNRSLAQWSSTLDILQQSPDSRTVFEILKISYDGLDEMEKKVFLDIACFSRQCPIEIIIELLYSSDNRTRIAIDVLVEKSLLTVSSHNKIGIHALIQEMGCRIARKECEEPGGWSRLGLHSDIFHVFRMNTGTEAIEGIFLHLHQLEEVDWNLEALSKMRKLKLLYIHNLRPSLGPKWLPNFLRFLHGIWYPSQFLPLGFQPDELTELSLIHTNIDQLWSGIKYLRKLKSIDLSYSTKLTRSPDFTGMQNLEKLVLEGCTNLVQVHPSIALLKRLRIWNFRNCKSIKSLPSEVTMEFLETFNVSGCSKLKMIPEFLGQMERLSKLSLSGTSVLLSSIERFSESLEELDLNGIVIEELSYFSFRKQNLRLSGLLPRYSSHPLVSLLSSLKHLSSLTTLKLNYCNLWDGAIPYDIGSLSSLKCLELKGNHFVTLPASIHLLSKLDYVNVENCNRLQQLPDLPENLPVNYRLKVRADNCTSLRVFPGPPDFCRLSSFSLLCTNCSSMVDNHVSSYFLYELLKRLLEGAPCSFLFLSVLIPGSEIPRWFNNQTVGNSVNVKLTSNACDSECIGIAFCALMVAQDNPSAIPDYMYTVHYSWIRNGYVSAGVTFPENQIVSDHLLLVVYSRHFLELQKYSLEDDTCNEVKFVFRTSRAVDNGSSQVMKCGARALYEHEMEELISTMKHSTGAIVKETPEAVTTGCPGGSDDEYYSAEE